MKSSVIISAFQNLVTKPVLVEEAENEPFFTVISVMRSIFEHWKFLTKEKTEMVDSVDVNDYSSLLHFCIKKCTIAEGRLQDSEDLSDSELLDSFYVHLFSVVAGSQLPQKEKRTLNDLYSTMAMCILATVAAQSEKHATDISGLIRIYPQAWEKIIEKANKQSSMYLLRDGVLAFFHCVSASRKALAIRTMILNRSTTLFFKGMRNWSRNTLKLMNSLLFKYYLDSEASVFAEKQDEENTTSYSTFIIPVDTPFTSPISQSLQLLMLHDSLFYPMFDNLDGRISDNAQDLDSYLKLVCQIVWTLLHAERFTRTTTNDGVETVSVVDPIISRSVRDPSISKLRDSRLFKVCQLLPVHKNAVMSTLLTSVVTHLPSLGALLLSPQLSAFTSWASLTRKASNGLSALAGWTAIERMLAAVKDGMEKGRQVDALERERRSQNQMAKGRKWSRDTLLLMWMMGIDSDANEAITDAMQTRKLKEIRNEIKQEEEENDDDDGEDEEEEDDDEDNTGSEDIDLREMISDTEKEDAKGILPHIRTSEPSHSFWTSFAAAPNIALSSEHSMAETIMLSSSASTSASTSSSSALLHHHGPKIFAGLNFPAVPLSAIRSNIIEGTPYACASMLTLVLRFLQILSEWRKERLQAHQQQQSTGKNMTKSSSEEDIIHIESIVEHCVPKEDMFLKQLEKARKGIIEGGTSISVSSYITKNWLTVMCSRILTLYRFCMPTAITASSHTFFNTLFQTPLFQTFRSSVNTSYGDYASLQQRDILAKRSGTWIKSKSVPLQLSDKPLGTVSGSMSSVLCWALQFFGSTPVLRNNLLEWIVLNEQSEQLPSDGRNISNDSLALKAGSLISENSILSLSEKQLARAKTQLQFHVPWKVDFQYAISQIRRVGPLLTVLRWVDMLSDWRNKTSDVDKSVSSLKSLAVITHSIAFSVIRTSGLFIRSSIPLLQFLSLCSNPVQFEMAKNESIIQHRGENVIFMCGVLVSTIQNSILFAQTVRDAQKLAQKLSKSLSECSTESLVDSIQLMKNESSQDSKYDAPVYPSLALLPSFLCSVLNPRVVIAVIVSSNRASQLTPPEQLPVDDVLTASEEAVMAHLCRVCALYWIARGWATNEWETLEQLLVTTLYAMSKAKQKKNKKATKKASKSKTPYVDMSLSGKPKSAQIEILEKEDSSESDMDEEMAPKKRKIGELKEDNEDEEAFDSITDDSSFANSDLSSKDMIESLLPSNIPHSVVQIIVWLHWHLSLMAKLKKGQIFSVHSVKVNSSEEKQNSEDELTMQEVCDSVYSLLYLQPSIDESKKGGLTHAFRGVVMAEGVNTMIGEWMEKRAKDAEDETKKRKVGSKEKKEKKRKSKHSKKTEKEDKDKDNDGGDDERDQDTSLEQQRYQKEFEERHSSFMESASVVKMTCEKFLTRLKKDLSKLPTESKKKGRKSAFCVDKSSIVLPALLNALDLTTRTYLTVSDAQKAAVEQGQQEKTLVAEEISLISSTLELFSSCLHRLITGIFYSWLSSEGRLSADADESQRLSDSATSTATQSSSSSLLFHALKERDHIGQDDALYREGWSVFDGMLSEEQQMICKNGCCGMTILQLDVWMEAFRRWMGILIKETMLFETNNAEETEDNSIKSSIKHSFDIMISQLSDIPEENSNQSLVKVIRRAVSDSVACSSIDLLSLNPEQYSSFIHAENLKLSFVKLVHSFLKSDTLSVSDALFILSKLTEQNYLSLSEDDLSKITTKAQLIKLIKDVEKRQQHEINPKQEGDEDIESESDEEESSDESSSEEDEEASESQTKESEALTKKMKPSVGNLCANGQLSHQISVAILQLNEKGMLSGDLNRALPIINPTKEFVSGLIPYFESASLASSSSSLEQQADLPAPKKFYKFALSLIKSLKHSTSSSSKKKKKETASVTPSMQHMHNIESIISAVVGIDASIIQTYPIDDYEHTVKKKHSKVKSIYGLKIKKTKNLLSFIEKQQSKVTDSIQKLLKYKPTQQKMTQKSEESNSESESDSSSNSDSGSDSSSDTDSSTKSKSKSKAKAKAKAKHSKKTEEVQLSQPEISLSEGEAANVVVGCIVGCWILSQNRSPESPRKDGEKGEENKEKVMLVDEDDYVECLANLLNSLVLVVCIWLLSIKDSSNFSSLFKWSPEFSTSFSSLLSSLLPFLLSFLKTTWELHMKILLAMNESERKSSKAQLSKEKRNSILSLIRSASLFSGATLSWLLCLTSSDTNVISSNAAKSIESLVSFTSSLHSTVSSLSFGFNTPSFSNSYSSTYPERYEPHRQIQAFLSAIHEEYFPLLDLLYGISDPSSSSSSAASHLPFSSIFMDSALYDSTQTSLSAKIENIFCLSYPSLFPASNLLSTYLSSLLSSSQPSSALVELMQLSHASLLSKGSVLSYGSLLLYYSLYRSSYQPRISASSLLKAQLMFAESMSSFCDASLSSLSQNILSLLRSYVSSVPGFVAMDVMWMLQNTQQRKSAALKLAGSLSEDASQTFNEYQTGAEENDREGAEKTDSQSKEDVERERSRTLLYRWLHNSSEQNWNKISAALLDRFIVWIKIGAASVFEGRFLDELKANSQTKFGSQAHQQSWKSVEPQSSSSEISASSSMSPVSVYSSVLRWEHFQKLKVPSFLNEVLEDSFARRQMEAKERHQHRYQQSGYSSYSSNSYNEYDEKRTETTSNTIKPFSISTTIPSILSLLSPQRLSLTDQTLVWLNQQSALRTTGDTRAEVLLYSVCGEDKKGKEDEVEDSRKIDIKHRNHNELILSGANKTQSKKNRKEKELTPVFAADTLPKTEIFEKVYDISVLVPIVHQWLRDALLPFIHWAEEQQRISAEEIARREREKKEEKEAQKNQQDEQNEQNEQDQQKNEERPSQKKQSFEKTVLQAAKNLPFTLPPSVLFGLSSFLVHLSHTGLLSVLCMSLSHQCPFLRSLSLSSLSICFRLSQILRTISIRQPKTLLQMRPGPNASKEKKRMYYAALDRAQKAAAALGLPLSAATLSLQGFGQSDGVNPFGGVSLQHFDVFCDLISAPLWMTLPKFTAPYFQVVDYQNLGRGKDELNDGVIPTVSTGSQLHFKRTQVTPLHFVLESFKNSLVLNPFDEKAESSSQPPKKQWFTTPRAVSIRVARLFSRAFSVCTTVTHPFFSDILRPATIRGYVSSRVLPFVFDNVIVERGAVQYSRELRRDRQQAVLKGGESAELDQVFAIEGMEEHHSCNWAIDYLMAVLRDERLFHTFSLGPYSTHLLHPLHTHSNEMSTDKLVVFDHIPRHCLSLMYPCSVVTEQSVALRDSTQETARMGWLVPTHIMEELAVLLCSVLQNASWIVMPLWDAQNLFGWCDAMVEWVCVMSETGSSEQLLTDTEMQGAALNKAKEKEVDLEELPTEAEASGVFLNPLRKASQLRIRRPNNPRRLILVVAMILDCVSKAALLRVQQSINKTMSPKYHLIKNQVKTVGRDEKPTSQSVQMQLEIEKEDEEDEDVDVSEEESEEENISDSENEESSFVDEEDDGIEPNFESTDKAKSNVSFDKAEQSRTYTYNLFLKELRRGLSVLADAGNFAKKLFFAVQKLAFPVNFATPLFYSSRCMENTQTRFCFAAKEAEKALNRFLHGSKAEFAQGLSVSNSKVFEEVMNWINIANKINT